MYYTYISMCCWLPSGVLLPLSSLNSLVPCFPETQARSPGRVLNGRVLIEPGPSGGTGWCLRVEFPLSLLFLLCLLAWENPRPFRSRIFSRRDSWILLMFGQKIKTRWIDNETEHQIYFTLLDWHDLFVKPKKKKTIVSAPECHIQTIFPDLTLWSLRLWSRGLDRRI